MSAASKPLRRSKRASAAAELPQSAAETPQGAVTPSVSSVAVGKSQKRKSDQNSSSATSRSTRPKTRVKVEAAVKAESSNIATKCEDLAQSEKSPTRVSTKRKKVIKSDEPEVFPPRITTAGATSHYIGAHISAAGGVENAPLNALRIGSNAFSCFVRPKMQWASKPIPDPSIADFRGRVAEHAFTDYAVPHGCYLVNLANPDKDKREKSYVAFLDDVQRCQALGVKLYNFHPGSTTGTITKEQGCEYVAYYINRVLEETQGVTVLVENMAGRRGNIIGGDLADLTCIISHVKDKSRIGVCIDTCHAFAAGYDFRTRETYEAFVKELDSQVGLKYVKAMHFNDSKGGLGENKDRHENIGAGQLGLWPFYAIVNDSRFSGIPLILETPGGEEDVMHSIWKHEIAALYMLQGKEEDKSDWKPVFDLLNKVQEIRNKSKEKLEASKAAKKVRAADKANKTKVKAEADRDDSEDD